MYNDFNYPNLNGLFDELDVQSSSTEMSFSVSVDDGETEWYVGLFKMDGRRLRVSSAAHSGDARATGSQRTNGWYYHSALTTHVPGHLGPAPGSTASLPAAVISPLPTSSQ